MIDHYWKWTLTEDYVLDLNTVCKGKYQYDDVITTWMSIKDNVLTIFSKYSWDGCTPKRIFFSKWIVGTPDGPINPITGKQWCYFASLVHDVLYQFGIGKRKHADKIFHWLLLGWWARGIYYRAVRLFGDRCGWSKK